MADTVGMAVQMASNALRFGLYYGVNVLIDRRGATSKSKRAKASIGAPMPTWSEIFSEMRNLFVADAQAVRDGIYPPMDSDLNGVLGRFSRIGRMMADLPSAAQRREALNVSSVREGLMHNQTLALPEYFLQDFHYQTGGYLSEESAKIYDAQVETLFYGAANAMRRTALKPIAREVHGRDQRKMRLIDVACGTGRFIRQVRLAFPALKITGADMSESYLAEARRHMRDLRPVHLVAANAEQLAFEDARFDIATTVFLYHELPGGVRRMVTRELARVVKPGGLMVMIDSLQWGDKPEWNGLIEVFPQRFHEPYYVHYAQDDLIGMFSEAGFEVEAVERCFLSKMIVCRRKA